MKYEHACPEWDFLHIDESTPEFFCCCCFNEEDAKIFKEMHMSYIDLINENSISHG